MTNPTPTPFGRSMRKEFMLNSNYINLNHGAYGTYPKRVQESLHKFQVQAEAHTDLWMRRDVKTQLEIVRRQLADLLNAPVDNLVMIQNDTSGINSILRSMTFQKGDQILHFSTVYYAMLMLIDYICHTNDKVKRLCFDVTYPMKNDDLVNNLKLFLEQHHTRQNPIKICLIDHITSCPGNHFLIASEAGSTLDSSFQITYKNYLESKVDPTTLIVFCPVTSGVVIPIEKIIPMMRSLNILVLIDGAHAIGQIPIDLTALDPDYYTTNCHKWLWAPRGCAVMFVRKELQETVHPSNISSYYKKQGDNFHEEFFWTGTMDYSPYCSVPAALEFRRELGGEEAIREYTHKLALEGGSYLAQRFGTEVLHCEENQVGSMVNVRLPLKNPADEKLNEEYFVNILLNRFDLFVGIFPHGGQFYMRVSAQVYNDLSDFEKCGDVFTQICTEINSN